MSASAAITMDVRTISPRERHPLIFRTLHDLARGDSFLLINDHDPKPLLYRFQADMPGQFDWVYLEDGPERWHARARKSAR